MARVTDVLIVVGPSTPGPSGRRSWHEHLLSSFFRELRLDDDELILSEIGAQAELGGRTIVDCSTAELDPQPRRLKAFAER